jgi:hypothetical protein
VLRTRFARPVPPSPVPPCSLRSCRLSGGCGGVPAGLLSLSSFFSPLGVSCGSFSRSRSRCAGFCVGGLVGPFVVALRPVAFVGSPGVGWSGVGAFFVLVVGGRGCVASGCVGVLVASRWSRPCFLLGVLAVFLFGGSRSLPPVGVAACASFGARAAALGWSASVGCAAGADLSFLAAFVAGGAGPRASVFAAGGPAGGFLSSASLPALRSAAAAGASVSWWAGGGPSVPLRARLAARSVAAASMPGLMQKCWVVSSPSSRGSLLSASVAVGRGVPVLFLCAGFAPALLSPLPGLSGSWVSCGVLFGLPAVCWLPAQLPLF